MNKVRSLVVKALYPLCSDEVKILIDQMRSNPDRFLEIVDSDSMPYHVSNPWAKALGHGRNFEPWEYHALKTQLRNLKIYRAKQLILEGLMEATEREANRSENKNMFDSIADQLKNKYTTAATFHPTKIVASQNQIEALKKAYEANQKRMQQEIAGAPLFSKPSKRAHKRESK